MSRQPRNTCTILLFPRRFTYVITLGQIGGFQVAPPLQTHFLLVGAAALLVTEAVIKQKRPNLVGHIWWVLGDDFGPCLNTMTKPKRFCLMQKARKRRVTKAIFSSELGCSHLAYAMQQERHLDPGQQRMALVTDNIDAVLKVSLAKT